MITAHFPQDACKFIHKGDPCSKRVGGRLLKSICEHAKVPHERSEEAMFGIRNYFKRNRKTPPQCDLRIKKPVI